MSDAPEPSPGHIAALKLAIDAGDGADVRLPAAPDAEGALAHGWLVREDGRLHVTESGWRVLKRADGVDHERG